MSACVGHVVQTSRATTSETAVGLEDSDIVPVSPCASALPPLLPQKSMLRAVQPVPLHLRPAVQCWPDCAGLAAPGVCCIQAHELLPTVGAVQNKTDLNKLVAACR